MDWQRYKTWLVESDPAFTATCQLAAPYPYEFVTDSRSIKAGDWFLPLVGANFDGHGFIEEAVKRGARGFFYNRGKENIVPQTLRPMGQPVTDTLTCLQSAASGWRKHFPNLTVAAITGSSGKTTTREFISTLFEATGSTLRTVGNFNNEIGVPLTLCQLKAEHRYVCLEFGARHRGDIGFLADLAEPAIAGVLNVGVSHLGEFGSVEALCETKLEMFFHGRHDSTLICYRDDARIYQGALRTGKPHVSFGRSQRADIRLVSEQFAGDGSMLVKIRAAGKDLSFPVASSHTTYAINLCAAVAVAEAAGLNLEKLQDALQNFRGLKGRYFARLIDGKTIIDDAYNANPESMRAGLQSVARGYPNHKKVLILGGMLELGPESPQLHYEVGAEAAAVQPAFLIAIGPEAKQMIQGAVEAGYPVAQTASYDEIADFSAAFKSHYHRGDLFYFKASQGIGLGKALASLFK